MFLSNLKCTPCESEKQGAIRQTGGQNDLDHDQLPLHEAKSNRPTKKPMRFKPITRLSQFACKRSRDFILIIAPGKGTKSKTDPFDHTAIKPAARSSAKSPFSGGFHRAPPSVDLYCFFPQ